MAKSRRKYAGIVENLPKIKPKDREWQARVELAKAEFTERTPAALARAYHKVRLEKDANEAAEKILNIRVEAAAQLLKDAYEAEGLMSQELENGTNVGTQSEPHAVVEDPEKFRRWCIKNGMETELQLPFATTNAMLKEMLLEGQPEPDGVRAFGLTKVVLRKG